MNRKLKNTLLRIIPSGIIEKIKKIKHKSNYHRIIYNLGNSSKNQPKVLLCYLPDFLFMKRLKNQYGTRHLECSLFVGSLLRHGCCVDVTDINNIQGFKNDYDYIIGFGEAFRVARSMNPKAKSILYLTEKTPDFSLSKETERCKYFFERHHKNVKKTRSGLFFKNEDFINLHSCIVIGKLEDLELLPYNIHGYNIYPTGLINERYNNKTKDMNYAKKHFLWLGSIGAIHKGLDILLDVFKRTPHLTLHIVGLHWKDRSIMQHLMSENTIDHGYMNINSDTFLNIVEQCAFCISPSCSEGVSTSVITAMNHGLIPLVSKESSIDISNIGEIFTDYHVENIENIVRKWSEADTNLLKKQSELTIKYANENYTLDKYEQRISEIINSIIFNNDCI